MTKSQLVAKLADDGGLSRKQMDGLVNDLVDAIVTTVKKGESVKIPRLGIFRLRKMKARVGRNPQTGEEIKIPAQEGRFSVAKEFKNRCSASGEDRPHSSRAVSSLQRRGSHEA
jgi:DNA-binding protein HU-beta